MMSSAAHRLIDRLAGISLRAQIMSISCTFVIVVAVVTWVVVSRSQQQVIQFEALKLAEVVVKQAASARSAYSSLAVAKLRSDGFGASEFSDVFEGHIPLPAQFLKELSRRSQQNADGMFSFRPVSKWNLAPEHGLGNDFQRWAWQQLEKQNRPDPGEPIPWEAVWRINEDENGKTLRYLAADPAASSSCVNCHNNLEKRPDVIEQRIADGVKPGHQWKLHELLGAIEITIPLDRVAALAKTQTRDGLLIVLGITVIGLCGVGLIVYLDTTRKQASTRELSFQANHDSLTGLPNRFALETALDARTQSAVHSDADSLTLLFLDLDNFKQVNDTLGHETGDKVLILAAERLRKAVPNDAIIARLGGDEFAVILQDCGNQKVNEIARNIDDHLAPSFEIDGFKLSIGVSIGAAVCPRHADTTSELLRCADVAMYASKTGKLTFSWYDSRTDTNAVSQLVMTDELREAIRARTLEVHYQPKYCLQSGRMIGLEALARWQSPSMGMIAPDIFITLAEHAGLIGDVTEQILQKATIQCQAWREQGHELSVSVNLSASTLHEGSLPDLIRQTLTETGLPAHALILEVTEGTIMRDIDSTSRILAAVRELGVSFSVDDYGSGYSSLSYLNKLPIAELKLDRAFITHVASNEKDAVIVSATLELARNLGLQMVAEGVEDSAALDYLHGIGCHQVQGYFLCKPLPAGELTRRLPWIARFEPKPVLPAAAKQSSGGEASDGSDRVA